MFLINFVPILSICGILKMFSAFFVKYYAIVGSLRSSSRVCISFFSKLLTFLTDQLLLADQKPKTSRENRTVSSGIYYQRLNDLTFIYLQSTFYAPKFLTQHLLDLRTNALWV